MLSLGIFEQFDPIAVTVDGEISLQLLRLEDAERIFDLVDRNRDRLREWLPWVDTNTTVEETRNFIRASLDLHRENFGFQAGMWYERTLTGVVGFHKIDWANRSVEFGYWIAREFEGRGIVTRSCRAMVDYAFAIYKLNRVQLRCATGNARSCAVIDRLGFVREGITRQAERIGERYVDLTVYGMTVSEWSLLRSKSSKDNSKG